MIDLKEKDELIEFKNMEEKMEKLKEWTIISPKATLIKTLYYKGAYTEQSVECDVIGYLSKSTRFECIDRVYETIVILVNGITHKIAPAYLKQMQSSKFNRFSTEEDAE